MSAMGRGPGHDATRHLHHHRDRSAEMVAAERSGEQIVALAEQGIRPSDIMTKEAFDNSIRLCMALGGSTNAIIHLIAIAGRMGLELPLVRFEELGRRRDVWPT